MKVRFNRDETVSIIGLKKEAYNAIRTIVMSSNNAFDEPNDEGDYPSNENFLCSLTCEEIEALDEIDWSL